MIKMSEMQMTTESLTNPAFKAASMREALFRCEAISCFPEIREQQCVRDMRNIIAAALASPPRNCDVGSAAEQTDRFWEYCKSHSCNECPARGGWRTAYIDGTSFKIIQCGVLWAQMPYEEGVAK